MCSCSDNVEMKSHTKISQLIAKLFEHDYKTFYVDILWKFLIRILLSERRLFCVYVYSIGDHEMPEINESHHAIDNMHDQTTVDA